MSKHSPTPYENTARIFLGIAGLVLAAGGIGASVLLWNRTLLEARLAMAILDVALSVFAVTAVGLALQDLLRQRKRRHDSDSSTQHRDLQLKLARRLATELNATLVRQRDGTCYLRIGPVEGVPVMDPGATFQEYDLNAIEEAKENWLSLMADSLDAELVYEGKSMTWYLRWSNIQETEERGDGS